MVDRPDRTEAQEVGFRVSDVLTKDEIERLTQEELARIKKAYEDGLALSLPEAQLRCRRDKDGGRHTIDNPAMAVVVLDLDDCAIRAELKRAAAEDDAFFVCVKFECWFIKTPIDAPDEERCAAEHAAATRTIDQHPHRREGVKVHIESDWSSIRIFEAEIVRSGDKATLTPWTEAQIQLPRPEFKRYLPEIRDGKKVITIGVGPLRTGPFGLVR